MPNIREQDPIFAPPEANLSHLPNVCAHQIIRMQVGQTFIYQIGSGCSGQVVFSLPNDRLQIMHHNNVLADHNALGQLPSPDQERDFFRQHDIISGRLHPNLRGA